MTRWMDRLQDHITEAGGLPWRLRHPRGGALVVPELGGRVLAVELDGRPCLWFHPGLLAAGRAPDWNAGGQRTWIAPEHAPQSLFEAGGAWRCPPELDPGAFREAAAGDGEEIRLAARFDTVVAGQTFRFQVRRRIRLESTGSALAVRVDQELDYEGGAGEGPGFGAWAILQVPAPGIALVEIAPRGDATPAGRPFHDDFFEPLPAGWWREGPESLALWMSGDRQFKAGFPADRLPPVSRVDYFCRPAGARRLLQITQTLEVPAGACFAEAPAGVPARGGDAVQLYNHLAGGPLGYAELEGHGPAGAPGAGVSAVSLRYEFDWLSGRELARILCDRGLAGFSQDRDLAGSA
jgi:hypothetical protein